MAERRELTPEDQEILVRVVHDFGAKWAKESAQLLAGIIRPGDEKENNHLEALRFIRDLLRDYPPTCVLRAINDLKPVVRGRKT